MRLILASASPRRCEILDQLGTAYELCPSSLAEETEETYPSRVVEDLARKKAENAAEKKKGAGEALILAADTVVALDGRILLKPADKKEAYHMIASISGRTHQVYTGVAVFLLNDAGAVEKQTCYSVMTEVSVRQLSPKQIQNYIRTGESMDKAGAYAIQGKFAPYIEGIQGDYYNVVGLPISSVAKTLDEWGLGGILC